MANYLILLPFPKRDVRAGLLPFFLNTFEVRGLPIFTLLATDGSYPDFLFDIIKSYSVNFKPGKGAPEIAPAFGTIKPEPNDELY